MPRSKIVPISMPDELYDKIITHKAKGEAVSHYVRTAIEKYIEDFEQGKI